MTQTIATPSATETSFANWNTLPRAEAEAALLRCCGSTRWATTLVSSRPFDDPAHLLHLAANLWFYLNESDWLEAFAAHPRIGEAPLPSTPFLASSHAEQAATHETLAPVAGQLTAANHEYEQKFGFRYVVSAQSRTAPELLALLQTRLTHTRAAELHEAAREQSLITANRLKSWLQL